MIPLHKKLALFACALTFALWAAGAPAATLRVAVVVGSNARGPSEKPLRCAEDDASTFTPHLVSGLRGAADTSGDGRVTLAEACGYTFDHTLFCAASSGVRQHPGYDYRAARVTVAAAEVKKVAWADLVSVASAPGAGKGSQRQDDALPEGVEGLSPEGRAEFDRGYLTMGERYQVFHAHHTVAAASDYLFAQGKSHQPLSESDFYRRVGREDLASSHQARKAGAAVLNVVGLGAVIGGVVYGVFGSEGCSLPPSDPNFGNVCVTQASVTGQSHGKVGFLTTLGGAVVLLGGGVLWANRHPVDLPGAAALAAEYNTALVRKLGGTPPTQPPKPELAFDVTPLLGSGGGRLVLSVRF